MTLGEKLAYYRKQNGMTQGQLGEYMNVSAQAVSKWENNLAEPDIGALRRLAQLYGISTDQLLSENDDPPLTQSQTETLVASVGDTVREQLENAGVRQNTIGFCTECGVTVTEETLGEKTPKVLCRDCVEARRRREEQERKAEEEKRERERRAKMMERQRRKKLVGWSIVCGAIVAAIVALLVVFAGPLEGAEQIAAAIVLPLFTFFFISMLFFEDSPTRAAFCWMAGRSIQWPGLIFSWDLDGFIWLIGMKILFAVLGFLAGVVFFCLGVVVAMFVSPFVFPFVIRQYIETGDAELDL